MDKYEQIKEKLEFIANEDELVRMWNEYVEKNIGKEPENIKLYLNNIENITNIISYMSIKGIAESIALSSYACYNSMDRYVYELSDRLYSTNSMFATIDTDALERFYSYLMENKAKKEWENDSANALTLWDKPYETLKVEITRNGVVFFRRGHSLTCYAYRPLHLLKCDNYFIGEIKATLEDTCQYNEEEFNNWLKSDCDMPPFPISVIFTSDYTEFTCKVYGE